MPGAANLAAAGRGHPVVVGALGGAAVAGGAAVVVAEEGGAWGAGGAGLGAGRWKRTVTRKLTRSLTRTCMFLNILKSRNNVGKRS